jgi:hypothetical protein
VRKDRARNSWPFQAGSVSGSVVGSGGHGARTDSVEPAGALGNDVSCGDAWALCEFMYVSRQRAWVTVCWTAGTGELRASGNRSEAYRGTANTTAHVFLEPTDLAQYVVRWVLLASC